jgi:hypothetical protein
MWPPGYYWFTIYDYLGIHLFSYVPCRSLREPARPTRALCLAYIGTGEEAGSTTANGAAKRLYISNRYNIVSLCGHQAIIGLLYMTT